MNHVEDVCPHCKSIDIDFSALEIVDTQVYYPCECNDCGTTFQQWYRLEFAEIDHIEVPEEEK